MGSEEQEEGHVKSQLKQKQNCNQLLICPIVLTEYRA